MRDKINATEDYKINHPIKIVKSNFAKVYTRHRGGKTCPVFGGSK